jgi:hypothetical protein
LPFRSIPWKASDVPTCPDQEQQDWAARFLRDKMDRINNQTARSPAMKLGLRIFQVGWRPTRQKVKDGMTV